MAKVTVALTVSLDGYIAGPNDGNELPLGEGGEALFEWYFNGDTPSRHFDMFRLSKSSAEVFDAGIDSVGAVLLGVGLLALGVGLIRGGRNSRGTKERGDS